MANSGRGIQVHKLKQEAKLLRIQLEGVFANFRVYKMHGVWNNTHTPVKVYLVFSTLLHWYSKPIYKMGEAKHSHFSIAIQMAKYFGGL